MLNNTNLLTPLIDTIKELTKIISEEITLLKTRRPKELEKILALKNQFMVKYHKEMADLDARGGLPASGDGATIRLLKKETRVFQDILMQHTRLVQALKKISENMIKAITDEVVRSQNQASHYGANGARTEIRSPTSLSLNRTI